MYTHNGRIVYKGICNIAYSILRLFNDIGVVLWIILQIPG